ncbi:putative allergen [Talaromyces proteolyticus]|uniref:Allergen n=1 Tax=Talaromyces proteolyticus TaxID=1131652 RepID=A0AAD4KJI2_9EURO|nr:putative allergen [Talaromyces proteolyticus]KAH8693766.1 putative allergen [Talaromyces proteolyticus]
MQFKNTALLLTALTAGSAMARSHIHERRHQHPARAVGDIVTAVIDGKVETWRNTYAGPTAAPEAPAAGGVQNAAVQNDAVAASSSTAVPTTTTATTSPTSTGSAFPTGFGGQTQPTGSGDTYCGNQGIPYGSNIIRIEESDLSKYDYTVSLDGSALTEDYHVIFWNKCDQEDQLTGWYAKSFPVDFTVPAGSIQYVAIDSDSQGGFVGLPASEDIPRNSYGSVLGFWGEFDFANADHDGWSGFDVSAIQAQLASQTNFPGLLIEGNGVISSITTNLGTVTNAYTSDEKAVGGIGGNIPAGRLALNATLGYSG